MHSCFCAIVKEMLISELGLIFQQLTTGEPKALQGTYTSAEQSASQMLHAAYSYQNQVKQTVSKRLV